MRIYAKISYECLIILIIEDKTLLIQRANNLKEKKIRPWAYNIQKRSLREQSDL